MEGGIVGYDSNTITGGSGVRIFGIGGSTQYQSDTVTVTLRTVSVATGEILTTVTVTKTVLSYMDKVTLLRFVGDGTTLGANANALEGEIGGSINESINKAIDIAVQAAVIQTINEGARKGHWAFKSDTVNSNESKLLMPSPVVPTPEVKIEPKVEAPKPEVKIEPKVEAPKPEVKVEPKVEEPKPEELSGKVYLKEMRYIFKEPNTKSQKTWQLPAGTEFVVVSTAGEWVQVVSSEKRKGYVLREELTTIKP
jgi:curli production assembly/transport component CsgG